MKKFYKGMGAKTTAAMAPVIALLLCLIGMVGAGAVQTAGGKIAMKTLVWESPQGHELSGYLFVPPNATAETPAPAIVCIEGWFNNKEMQDAYFTEFARRGYVVLALDMHGHGNSENTTLEELYDGGVGVDGAVVLLDSLYYVDSGRIGVTGHSSGGTASNMAIVIDNARERPLIRANLLQAADWNDDTGADHSADFGNRHIGIIASQFDDFYFAWYEEDGTPISLPKDFIGTPQAKQFLNFNDSPLGFDGTPVSSRFYTRNFGGVTAQRVIYTPYMIHPWVVFSKTAVGHGIDFFETVFGAPQPLPAANQVWQWKTVFNFIGLCGFFIFMVTFTLYMLQTPAFAGLAAAGMVKPAPKPTGQGLLWFWGSLVVSALFSGFSYLFIVARVYGQSTAFWPQTGPLTISAWAAACGGFSILVMALSFHLYGKKHGMSLRESGVLIGVKPLLKTLLLSLIVVVITFSIVFLAAYFFKTDFRVWVLAVKAFGADKIGIAVRYLPLFLLYYITNSVTVNCFNYNALAKREWVNTAVMGLGNVIAAIVIVVIQYSTFFTTGNPFWYMAESDRIGPIWLFPVIVILFGAAVVSRIIYKRTRNPYLAGIINGIMVTLISCSNTTTILGSAKVVTTTF
ncbi:MAG: hypothetical protein LBK40_07060 [Spirochaetaceae bacterium]|jgi:pimeloyl-ACP methyl ester carboxylesterase|nr:hypothetical protein [Spirochaetaceae bacterium]